MNSDKKPTGQSAEEQFAHAIGHELKHPLSLIQGYNYRLKQWFLRLLESEEGMQALPKELQPDDSMLLYPDKIERQVQTLTVMLDNLADLSRVTADSFSIKRKRDDFGEFVNRVAQDVAAADINHEYEIIVPEHRVPYAFDYMRMKQVILNLISNARRYSPMGTTVRISLIQDSTQIVLTVEDQGEGVPEEAIESIFEPFQRAVDRASESNSDNKGLGLGLALVKTVVEKHGGTVRVSAADGDAGGAVFVLSLPRSSSHSK